MNYMLDSGFYKRQLCIKEWDNDKLKNQKALVLGLGGIGSTVVVNLCRLGIANITLVDDDVVEEDDINRQILFNGEDAAKRDYKVNCARRDIFNKHAHDTIIYTSRIDAIRSWSVVRDFIDNCTCVFQCMDLGDYFDAAIS